MSLEIKVRYPFPQMNLLMEIDGSIERPINEIITQHSVRYVMKTI